MKAAEISMILQINPMPCRRPDLYPKRIKKKTKKTSKQSRNYYSNHGGRILLNALCMSLKILLLMMAVSSHPSLRTLSVRLQQKRIRRTHTAFEEWSRVDISKRATFLHRITDLLIARARPRYPHGSRNGQAARPR